MAKKIPEILINERKVSKLFQEISYKWSDLDEAGKPPAEGISVEASEGHFVFHPEKLEMARESVTELLKLLPRSFRKKESYLPLLEARLQDNGAQWTSIVNSIEVLLSLGIGLGLVDLISEKDIISRLPPPHNNFFVYNINFQGVHKTV